MNAGYPLTFAQESIYFLNDLTNGMPVYHMPQAFRLRGKLDVPTLDRALRTVVQRHEALRTAMIDTPRGPRQIPHEPSFELRVVSLSSSEIETILSNHVAAPFDLQNGKGFRADLFRTGGDEHVLLLNLHHALGDMSSLGILFRELGAAYSNTPLPDGITQLGEYATRKRAQEPAAETIDFWRSTLKDYATDLDLPLDRTRPRFPSFAGEAIYQDWPSDLTAGVRQLARAQRSSIYNICLAALEILIHRSTGQQRFCIGTPFSDREDPALENTIGYLVNLLPLPCEIQAGEPFTKVLASVRAASLEAYANSSISFRRILKELNLASDSPKPPLARIVFQHFPEMPRLELAGIQCQPLRVHSRTSKFDLCFSLFEYDGTMTAEIEYDTDILTRDSAQLWGKQYQTLLRSIVATPNETVARLNIVSEEEKRLIQNWNNSVAPYPREATVHQLFEEQAAARPNAIALASESGKMTYHQLNARANGVAKQLQDRGVKPGDFVGVCLKRSAELIVSLLGILKAGAAFVPLEANYPPARLQYLFRDSGVRVLITDSRNARIAPAGTELLFLNGAEGPNVSFAGSATDIAYVMYTSGSTGDPKGVMVPHRAITRLVKNNDFASFSRDEIWLAFAPVSFDASTLEIWGPLLNGGTVALYPSEFLNVEQFETVLKKFNVTSLWLTAGLFNTIIDQKAEALRGVRQLLVGGDVLSIAHIRKALNALPDTRLINGYGPTENTTFTCCYTIPRDCPADRPIPIGRPIRNTQVFILDESMEAVPIGVPGDLHAAGDGLAAGYLNKRELTESAFIKCNNQRLYRTGDRARFLPDGNIEFLGRRDGQVKVRGFRIELGEVEGALRKIPTIQDACVVAHSDSGGSKQLVAYIVSHHGSVFDPVAIAREVAKVLPSHACPSIIIPLSELPLGPNGKVDRRALPPPGSLEIKRECTDPKNAIEARLVEIWRQILEVPAVSVDDNFFHLGGESLRATRAISQINRAFDCGLTLPRIFEAPTVRQMAEIVARSSERSADTMRKSLGIRPETDPIEVDALSDQEVDDLLNQLVAANDSAR
jgi:amino acid adenylation domain-containing protein